ncbi:glyoxylase-like metal-dependent hydrolase (beta-lactamase superfamily II) [Antricoccus suffuscus]|uniref:Glyoxylase-like metal-dependent hydrolase (Beta-lactamase superfamily II) n=1 Tax=Antricoccus suffuscus TaxID=1629062 RepID=A0A2T1A5Y3_9ACTN|nr:MBL fold metallo-hydrolase [Antricoccus suffuscus]PRZ44022.1 glyoxylase-like metal-dependent hydrolase (beta-lactamase superfamily II) [Antricoccus suffuscus]
MIDLNYPRGLHDLGNGCYSWMLPDGSWGWSNSGLITGKGESLLVDTHFDLALTQEMLDGIAHLTKDAPLKYAAITHSNGDHYFGNELLPDGTEIIASKATNADMTQADVTRIQGMKSLEGAAGDFARSIFGPFDFSGITATPATRTFEGETTVDVGGVEVQLIQVGPAHTAGDIIAYVPSAKTLYAGDILFIGGTPIAWAGPLQRWIDACDLMLGLDVETVVPGHGPVTDKSGIIANRDYLSFVQEKATEAFHKGVTAQDAARNMDLGKFAELNERGRVVQNVLNVYHQLDPAHPAPEILDIFEEIARLEGFGEPATKGN